MTWTNTQPVGSSKIRLLPDLLRQRWTNIQQGTVPSEKWLLAFRAGNPATVAGAGNIFTKQNSGGFVELFFKDDNSNTTRLTNQGGVGYWTQSLYGTDVKLESPLSPGTTQTTNPQGAFITAQGRVTSGGSVQPGGFGIASCSHPSTGRYVLTFTDAVATVNNWGVVATVRDSTAAVAMLHDQSTTTFEIRVRDISDGSLASRGFSFIVVGGRSD